MRSFLTLPLIAALVALTSGCSATFFTTVNAPTKFDNIKRIKNITFDDTHKLALDVYQEKEISGKHPVVIFFYGGSWREGKKAQYEFVGSKFSKNGYITVIPDYRKYPDVKFPDFVEDGAKAVAWVINNIDKYNGDVNNIYIAGHSAGAHIGSLLASDERYLAPYKINPDTALAGFIGLSGGYDFIPEKESRKAVFVDDKKNGYHNVAAARFLSGDEPPMLLLHGEKDEIVEVEQTYLFEKDIKAKGGEVEIHVYPDKDHLNIMGDVTWIGQDKEERVFSDILAFMKKYHRS